MYEVNRFSNFLAQTFQKKFTFTTASQYFKNQLPYYTTDVVRVQTIHYSFTYMNNGNTLYKLIDFIKVLSSFFFANMQKSFSRHFL